MDISMNFKIFGSTITSLSDLQGFGRCSGDGNGLVFKRRCIF